MAKPTKPKSKSKSKAAPRGKAKTTSRAKAPARRGAKRAKSLFDRKTLTSIREKLLAMQKDLEEELEAVNEAAFNASQSEMSGEVGYDEDFADAGSYTFEREKDLSIANNIQDLLSKIARSLEKIDEGTYGVCENCGGAIEAARLKALPHALLCVKCKTLEERR